MGIVTPTKGSYEKPTGATTPDGERWNPSPHQDGEQGENIYSSVPVLHYTTGSTQQIRTKNVRVCLCVSVCVYLDR